MPITGLAGNYKKDPTNQQNDSSTRVGGNHNNLQVDRELIDIFEEDKPYDPVVILAPEWVKGGFNQLMKRMTVNHLNVPSSPTNSNGSTSTITVPVEWFGPLIQLRLLGRMADMDTEWNSHYPEILDPQVIQSLRDLARQTVTVMEEVNHDGSLHGYPTMKKKPKVFNCHVNGLQFKSRLDTGRLVLLSEGDSNLQRGLLDRYIYKMVVGEEKSLYLGACNKPDRFRFCESTVFGRVLFDTMAYKMFVAKDVYLTGRAFLSHPGSRLENLNLNFFNHGAGNVFCQYGQTIEELFVDGVIDGLEYFFENYSWAQRKIKAIYLPGVKSKQTNEKRVADFKNKFGVCITFHDGDDLYTVSADLASANVYYGDINGFGEEIKAKSAGLEPKSVKRNDCKFFHLIARKVVLCTTNQ